MNPTKFVCIRVILDERFKLIMKCPSEISTKELATLAHTLQGSISASDSSISLNGYCVDPDIKIQDLRFLKDPLLEDPIYIFKNFCVEGKSSYTHCLEVTAEEDGQSSQDEYTRQEAIHIKTSEKTTTNSLKARKGLAKDQLRQDSGGAKRRAKTEKKIGKQEGKASKAQASKKIVPAKVERGNSLLVKIQELSNEYEQGLSSRSVSKEKNDPKIKAEIDNSNNRPSSQSTASNLSVSKDLNLSEKGKKKDSSAKVEIQPKITPIIPPSQKQDKSKFLQNSGRLSAETSSSGSLNSSLEYPDYFFEVQSPSKIIKKEPQTPKERLKEKQPGLCQKLSSMEKLLEEYIEIVKFCK